MTTELEFLKAAQVGALLGVSDSRIYQLAAANLIPARRFGRAVRFPRRAIETWLNEQSEAALADLIGRV